MTKTTKPIPATAPPAMPTETSVSALTMIERLATNKDTNPAVLDRLMTAYESERARADKMALHNALANVKAELAVVKFPKNTVVDFQAKSGRKRYNFAALPDIKKIVDPVLAAAGLSYTYEEFMTTAEQKHDTAIRSVITIRGHGAEITAEKSAFLYQTADSVMNPMQAAGAHSTYMHRYVLCGALGIAPDEDNSGEPSDENITRPNESHPPKAESKGQWDNANAARKDVGKKRGFDAYKLSVENPDLNKRWLEQAKKEAGKTRTAEFAAMSYNDIYSAFVAAAIKLKIGKAPKRAE